MIPQLLANGIIAASVYGLLGVAFALGVRVFRFFDFSLGAAFTVGGYAAWALGESTSLPLLPASGLALLGTGGIGVVLHLSVYSRLRERNASSLEPLLASLGLYVVIQNLLSLTFGDAARELRGPQVTVGMEVLGARITTAQVGMVLVSGAIILAYGIWLHRTRLGRQICALADDRDLAILVGLPSRVLSIGSAFLAFALAGAAGIITSLDRAIVPSMGLPYLLLAIVACIIGGMERVSGVLVGAILIGLIQNLSLLWIAAAWQDAIVFLVLVAFLFLRPQGVLGRPSRRIAV